jgi:Holliday junction DNA helicase RuvB
LTTIVRAGADRCGLIEHFGTLAAKAEGLIGSQMNSKSNRREVNDVAPSSISHIIGQQSVVNSIKIAIDSAFADDRRFDHSMLVGPPGMGKSAVANVISEEMATSFIEVLGQSVKKAADLNGLLLQTSDKTVVHIDEAHELPKPIQTALYLALDKRKIFISGSKSVSAIPVADFTLLLSTTDEFHLLAPLRDRMRLVLRFDFYSEPDLVRMLHQRIRALGWDIHEELFPKIAQRSRGTPRLALRLLQACHRVCRADGSETITPSHFHRACELDELDSLGLGPLDQKYLRLLVDGPARLNVLAAALGLDSRTISKVVEPFLIRAKLVVKDEQSKRQLTARGYEHVAETSSTPSVPSMKDFQ